MLGLYIHIPFCAVKCGYCDFYSLNYNRNTVEEYVEYLCSKLKSIDRVFDTVYFGGGTPSIIGGDNLTKILSFVNHTENAEITVEVNPRSFEKDFFRKISKAGFNRVSIGMQSGDDEELKLLTRKHNCSDVKETVESAKKAGIDNISLDLMIGIQNQTPASLKKTLDFAIGLDVNHLSCYMLRIEENTPFSAMNLNLPNDDSVADMYLFLCKYLKENNFNQYEISNFAKDGFESKHNLLYWNLDEYIGLGPSAHSFVDNKRYYYSDDINLFLSGKESIYSQDGGDLYDYIMLGLRLNKGISLDYIKDGVYEEFGKKADKYIKLGYGTIENGRFKLNEKGFLIQNTILTDLLEEIK